MGVWLNAKFRINIFSSNERITWAISTQYVIEAHVLWRHSHLVNFAAYENQRLVAFPIKILRPLARKTIDWIRKMLWCAKMLRTACQVDGDTMSHAGARRQSTKIMSVFVTLAMSLRQPVILYSQLFQQQTASAIEIYLDVVFRRKTPFSANCAIPIVARGRHRCGTNSLKRAAKWRKQEVIVLTTRVLSRIQFQGGVIQNQGSLPSPPPFLSVMRVCAGQLIKQIMI